MAKKEEIKAEKTSKTTAAKVVEKVIEKITPIKEEILEEVVLDTPDVQVLKFLAKSKSDGSIKINDVLEQTGLPLGILKVLLGNLKEEGFINIQNNYRDLGNVSHSGKHDLSNVVVKAIITDKGLGFISK